MINHEIECEILLYDRQKKYACIDLGRGNLKAIVNRKTGNIKFVFYEILAIYEMQNKVIYELENGYGEHFAAWIDEENKLCASQPFDDVYEVLTNYIICQKSGKRYLIDLAAKGTNVPLSSNCKPFESTNTTYAIMYNKYGSLCFVDKKTLQLVGPRNFEGISIQKGANWLIVFDKEKHKIIVRTDDFGCSDTFTFVKGYQYWVRDRLVISTRHLIVGNDNGLSIFDIETMMLHDDKAYQDIVPISAKRAKVKLDDGSWTIITL